MNASLIVALEQHADPALPGARYADADARALAAAWEAAGFAAEDRILLVNAAATKTAVDSALRRTLKKLTADDTLWVFLAGGGFVVEGAAFMACHDSPADDLEATSLDVSQVLRQLSASKSGRIAVFCDFFRNEPAEWATFDAGRCLYFAACDGGEISNVAPDLGRGIWAYQLEQAFLGREPAALRGREITVGGLQHSLIEGVARMLRQYAPGQVQTPIAMAPAEDTVLADLSDSGGEATSHLGQIKDSVLLAESSHSLRSLPGFATVNKRAIPTRCDSYGLSFVIELAAEELEAEVARIRAALKRAFKFTRLQLSAQITPGAATITTPHFNYNVSVTQHATEADAVVWTRSVDAVTAPEEILSPEFETVFGDVFRTVQLSLHGETDLEGLIDELEARRDNTVRLDYADDAQIDALGIHFRGMTCEVRVTRKSFAVTHARAEKPRELLKSLFAVQTALASRVSAGAVPFGLPN